ncbi:MAG: LysM peptidoglycan-binding domain-containing protein [Anaerolineales bacterium]|nr:MAG: LysM peptidoglycan-binding domain-containing protein [Anaerolineales bacterium]
MTQDKKRVYVVELGDSLSKIAKEVYGDGSRWREIFEANKDKISDPGRIYPGQELRIPYGPGEVAEPFPTEPPTEPPAEMPIPEELKPFVTVGSVDLFNGPSMDDEVVGALSPGESLEIVGRNADSSWWQVATPDGLAWVAASVVTASNIDDRIPIVEAPPPPIQPTPIEPPPEPTEPPPPPRGEIVGESYGDFSVNTAPTDPPAEEHPDLNLTMRGYEPINAYKGLVDYGGATDPNAPQLPGLFADNRTPTFSTVYQLYGWDWERKRRGSLVTNPEVSMAGLAVTPGETIHVPDSGYSIGGGYEMLVLYATPERITLKYTPDDHVIWGYTLHVENIYVEPRLLALYQSWNEAGRGRLPALRAGQAFGRARGDEIGVVIRDRGAFMDPRSRKDWWQGR